MRDKRGEEMSELKNQTDGNDKPVCDFMKILSCGQQYAGDSPIGDMCPHWESGRCGLKVGLCELQYAGGKCDHDWQPTDNQGHSMICTRCKEQKTLGAD